MSDPFAEADAMGADAANADPFAEADAIVAAIEPQQVPTMQGVREWDRTIAPPTVDPETADAMRSVYASRAIPTTRRRSIVETSSDPDAAFRIEEVTPAGSNESYTRARFGGLTGDVLNTLGRMASMSQAEALVTPSPVAGEGASIAPSVAIEGAQQGLSAGWSDEATAAARAAMDPEVSYQQAVDAERQRLATLQREEPGSYGFGMGAGVLASPLPFRTASQQVLAGGLAGAGFSEGGQESLEGAASGAALSQLMNQAGLIGRTTERPAGVNQRQLVRAGVPPTRISEELDPRAIAAATEVVERRILPGAGSSLQTAPEAIYQAARGTTREAASNLRGLAGQVDDVGVQLTQPYDQLRQALREAQMSGTGADQRRIKQAADILQRNINATGEYGVTFERARSIRNTLRGLAGNAQEKKSPSADALNSAYGTINREIEIAAELGGAGGGNRFRQANLESVVGIESRRAARKLVDRPPTTQGQQTIRQQISSAARNAADVPSIIMSDPMSPYSPELLRAAQRGALAATTWQLSSQGGFRQEMRDAEEQEQPASDTFNLEDIATSAREQGY